mmetsp:Transcript_47490/g.90675  ORF Transcript_47490/g.90675 Transcript_47490/m.90675 type:complete len:230 (-) Transcript_47490:1206-1895(-)
MTTSPSCLWSKCSLKNPRWTARRRRRIRVMLWRRLQAKTLRCWYAASVARRETTGPASARTRIWLRPRGCRLGSDLRMRMASAHYCPPPNQAAMYPPRCEAGVVRVVTACGGLATRIQFVSPTYQRTHASRTFKSYSVHLEPYLEHTSPTIARQARAVDSPSSTSSTGRKPRGPSTILMGMAMTTSYCALSGQHPGLNTLVVAVTRVRKKDLNVTGMIPEKLQHLSIVR